MQHNLDGGFKSALQEGPIRERWHDIAPKAGRHDARLRKLLTENAVAENAAWWRRLDRTRYAKVSPRNGVVERVRNVLRGISYRSTESNSYTPKRGATFYKVRMGEKVVIPSFEKARQWAINRGSWYEGN